MADAMLEHVYKAPAIDWAGGYDVQKMNERREAYIAALKAADQGDVDQLMNFVGTKMETRAAP